MSFFLLACDVASFLGKYVVFACCIWLLHPPEIPLWLSGSVRNLAVVTEVEGCSGIAQGNFTSYAQEEKKNNTDQTTKNPFCPLLSSSICQQLGPCSGSSEQSSRVLYIWGVPEAEKNTRPCSCTSTALTPRVLGEELKPQNLSLDGHE